MDLKINFEKNLDFFRSKNLSLAKHLSDLSEQISFSPLNKNNDQYSLDYEVRVGNSVIFNAIFLQATQAFAQQFKSPKRILFQRIIGDSIGKSIESILSDVVGSEELILLNSLPCFSEDITPSARTFEKSALAPASVLLGACSLLFVDSLILEKNIKSLMLVESDFMQLTIALHLIDLQGIIHACKEKGIAFELLLNQSFSGAPQRFPVILNVLANKQPASVLGFNVFRSPSLSPDMIQVESWISSDDGYLELVKGYLGNDTDEINQVMHALHNALCRPDGMIMPQDLAPFDSPAVLVASGPSLDDTVEQLAALERRPLIISCGSSVGTLVKNNIKPDLLVLLEQSWIVYHDLVDLISEGYDLSGITLFGSSTLDPRVFELFDESCVFHRPLSSSLILFPEEEFAILPQAGPQAANAGLEVAMKLGFRNLLLLGCDFGAPDEEYQRSLLAMGTSPRNLTLPLLGSKGKTIYSSPELSVTRQLFEHIILLYGAKVYSVGEGSRIEGVQSVAFDEAINMLPADQCLDVKINLLSKMKTRSIDKSSLLNVLDECMLSCKETTQEMVKASSNLSEPDSLYHCIRPFISWEYRSGKHGVDLYYRLTKFLYFFILQFALEDANAPNEKKSYLLIQSLEMINAVYLTYISLLKRLVTIPRKLKWDPLLMKNMLVKEYKSLSVDVRSSSSSF